MLQSKHLQLISERFPLRKLNVREMRAAIGRLDDLVDSAGELIVSRRGMAIARILPVSRRQPRPDHADLRERMPRLSLASRRRRSVTSAMSAEQSAYLDTSVLAKWYLNEAGSEEFVPYVQGLDVAVICSLTQPEMRSLLARRRRMGDLSPETETVIYAAVLQDIAEGSLRQYAVEDARRSEAANPISRYPEHPLGTLDALHLAVARSAQVDAMATADTVMAAAAGAMGFVTMRF